MSDFEKYIELNDFLLALIMNDKGESYVAEVIRDRMDIHWKAMSFTEQEWIRSRNENVLND